MSNRINMELQALRDIARREGGLFGQICPPSFPAVWFGQDRRNVPLNGYWNAMAKGIIPAADPPGRGATHRERNNPPRGVSAERGATGRVSE